LGVGSVLGLENERFVGGENLEGFGNVAPSLLRHLDAPNRTHVQMSHVAVVLVVVRRVFV